MLVKYRPQLVAAACAAALSLVLAVIPAAGDPNVGSLRSGIAAAQARERSLSAGVSNASTLIATLTRQLSILTARVADVQAQLALDTARLARLRGDVAAERALLGRLRTRYASDRAELERWLVAVYEDGRPDVVQVIFQASGFADLLERLDFLNRLSSEGDVITAHARDERDAAKGALVRLAQLTAAQARATAAAAAESAALQSIQSELSVRRTALDRVRAVEMEALGRTRAQEASLQHQLQQALASLAPSYGAPAGESFTIPWAIVQCESGGQNLPPNSAGASGYYQIIPATWKDFGGTGPQAYEAPKAEQDAVAARIWNGGAGASNWVCAGLVGIT